MNMGRHKKHKREQEISARKHYDTFYASAPPGMIKEEPERPEDSIPDRPENKQARNFLSQAPTKGLWMPLGKEVKVMQCWRCKSFGHRTGDKECPMFQSGNMQTERFRWSHEDPMHSYIKDQERRDKEARVQELQALLEWSSSSSSDTDSSDSSSDMQHRKRKRRQKKHGKDHNRKDSHQHSSKGDKCDKHSKKEDKQRAKKHNRDNARKGDKHQNGHNIDNRQEMFREYVGNKITEGSDKYKSDAKHRDICVRHNTKGSDIHKSERDKSNKYDIDIDDIHIKYSEKDKSRHLKHKKAKHKKKHKD